MSPERAERIAKLEPGDITTINSLAALSQKADDIIRIAREIKDGHASQMPDTASASGPRTLRIIARSFVKDRNQYNATYGLTDEKASELAILLNTHPEEACNQIKTIAMEKLSAKGSGRNVEVHLSSLGPESTTNPDSDGGAKELSAEISRNPGLYGLYQFEAEPTGLSGQYQFGVHLGDDLFAIGQSKKVVIAAARICRVKGRNNELMKSHIWYWTKWASAVRGDDIPDSVWDGKQGVHDPIKPRKTEPPKAAGSRKRPLEEGEIRPEDVD